LPGHRGQQAGQIGADVGDRKRDLDLGAVEHATVRMTIDVRAGQRGLQRRRERLDAHDAGARALLQFAGLAGQREEGAAGLLAGDHLAIFSEATELSTK
jgi:hypothetical protein